MDRLDRIFDLHRYLSHRRTPATIEEISSRLQCSKATVYRLISQLRDRLDAPVARDKKSGGWLYDRGGLKPVYELPGLWFSAAELQALLVFQRLLRSLEPGFLDDYLAPLGARIDRLLTDRRLNLTEAQHRIRVLTMAARPAGDAFRTIASATLQRLRLNFSYHSRGRNQISDRDVSPQRLVHYRDNWYLDAWDHDLNELRSFSLDRIKQPRMSDEAAADMPASELDAVFASSYGIFSGKADQLAVLRFSPERARWVADERWHPEQSGCFLSDGRYELRVPYHDARELVMDILRHGADVEVVAPDSLRREVTGQLKNMARLYGGALAID